MQLTETMESKQPVISVVVLCYNQQQFIGECLESVMTQEVDAPFDVVIGDDGSTDGSRAVIESVQARYPGRITLVSHERNVGYSRNFADTLARTRGEYIACLDGDDLMLPGKLARQFEFLETQREFGMVVHRMRTVDWITKEPVPFPLANDKPAVFDAEYLIEHGPFFFTSSSMFRAALRRRFPVNLDLKVVADVANLMQSFYGTKARYLDEEMGLYRVNPKGFTSTVIKNPARHETNIQDMMGTYQMAQDLGMDRAVVDRGRARLYMRSAIMFLEAGEYAQFERYIETSVGYASVGTKQGVLHAMRHWPHALRSLYGFAKQMAGRQPVRA